LSGYRTLKSIHLASTGWLILCVVYILVLSLRQAGVHWWIIFSLSGHSALIIFILISLYLFAILRGVSRAQAIELEHPLTSTNYYKGFYVTAPFLGGLAGCLGIIGTDDIAQFAAGIALGTFMATFLVWVILDPATGFIEMMFLPASRKHRAERIAQAKTERENKQKNRERLLAEILVKEESNRHQWQQVLKPQAEKLAAVLSAKEPDLKNAECDAVEIGLKAWQIGGLNCMRELHNMAIAILKQNNKNENYIIDYIPFWWDGIGSWRAPSLDKAVSTS
jgi:large-conductance mechanosensitive channel